MELRVAFGLLSCAIALSVTACGGGSTSSGGVTSGRGAAADPPTVTKAVLIERGDAICTKTDSTQRAKLKAYEKEHPDELTGKTNEEKTLRAVAIPPVATEVKELQALGAPPGEEAKVEAILTGLKEAVKIVEAETNILVEQGEGPFSSPDKLAAEYGFKACAKAL